MDNLMDLFIADLDTGLPQPVYTTVGMFTILLKRPKKTSEKISEKTSEKTSEKILKLIKTNPEITINELAKQLNKTTRAVEMQIKKLKENNKIVRIGSDKVGSWQIINNN